MVGKKPSKDTLRAMANPPKSWFSNHARAHGFIGSAMPTQIRDGLIREVAKPGPQTKSGLGGPTSVRPSVGNRKPKGTGRR